MELTKTWEPTSFYPNLEVILNNNSISPSMATAKIINAITANGRHY